MRRLGLSLVLLVLFGGACGGGDSLDASATVPSEATSSIPATTTSTSTTTSTPTTTTSTTTTSTTTTTTVPPVPETMALGTIQVALLAAETDGSVVLPEPPFGLSMTIEGDGEPVVYLFVDPDPGHFSKTSDDGDVLLAITTRTFAVPLEPGDYTITEVQVWSDVFGAADNETGAEFVALPPVPASGGETGAVQPHFTVVDGEPCTFIGEITSVTTRLPPGDSVETISMAQEYAGGAPAMLSMDPEGALMSGQMGLNLLDDVIDPEYLSGNSWWLDGKQVDDTLCITLEASFEPQ